MQPLDYNPVSSNIYPTAAEAAASATSPAKAVACEALIASSSSQGVSPRLEGRISEAFTGNLILPADLLTSLPIRSLLRLKMTCRGFRLACQMALVRKINAEKLPISSILVDHVHLFAFLTSLGRGLSELHYLDLREMWYFEEKTTRILRLLPKIKTLYSRANTNFINKKFLKKFPNFKQLKRLDILITRETDIKTIVDSLKDLKNLSRLEIKFTPDFDGFNDLHHFKILNTLKSLDMDFSYIISLNIDFLNTHKLNLYKILEIKSLSRITSLTINRCTAITGREIEELAPALPLLTHLDASRSGIESNELATLAKKLPPLSGFKYEGDRYLTAEELNSFVQVQSKLTSLSVRECVNLSVSALPPILEQLPELTSLNLIGLKMKREDLEKIRQALPKLKTLSISTYAFGLY